MTEEDFQDIKKTVHAFFNAMMEWEAWSATLDYGGDTDEQRLDRLKAIFDQFLSKKARWHQQSRYDLLDFGTPLAFRQPIVKVEEAKKEQVLTERNYVAFPFLRRSRMDFSAYLLLRASPHSAGQGCKL